MVDLTKQKLDGKDIVTWSMKGGEEVKELGVGWTNGKSAEAKRSQLLAD